MDTKTRSSLTIVERIANELNIAVSTVYAILADRKSCFASQNLKKQVKRMAEELGYKPNYIAVSLKKGKTGTIGLIVSDMYGETTLARIENMTKLAYKDKHHILVGCSYDNSVLEEELLQEFYYRKVDGIAIAPARQKGENKFLNNLIEQKFPLISFTHIENSNVDYVSTDYFAGGYMAGEHLLKMGYSKYGLLSVEIRNIATRERIAGFEKALADSGYHLDASRTVFVKDETIEEIEKGAEKLLKAGVDGVFCTNDRFALILMKKAISKGKKIPLELGIIGFDDTELGRMCLIPLTSIRQKIKETAAQIYSSLIRKIHGDNTPCRILVKPELIVRESTKRK